MLNIKLGDCVVITRIVKDGVDLDDFPKRKSQINNKAMVGYVLDGKYRQYRQYGEYKEYDFYGVKILRYISGKNSKFKVEYNGEEKDIYCNSFLNGKFGEILNIDLNNKWVDDNGVLHIYIYRDDKQYEALYKGDNIELVKKVNWCIKLRKGKVESVLGKIDGKNIYLHRVDFEDVPSTMVIDHNSNTVVVNGKAYETEDKPLNCIKDNLLIKTKAENNKNKDNKLLQAKSGKWYSKHKITRNGKGIRICTSRKEKEEAEIDRIIVRWYLSLGNSDNHHILDNLSEERIKEVTDLVDKKTERGLNKELKPTKYNHKIEKHGDYNILNWYNREGELKQMLFDNDIDISHCCVWLTDGYWSCEYVEDGRVIKNKFYRMVLGLRPNDKYSEYGLDVDHLNHVPNDNRRSNLIITTHYSNCCNKKGKGYSLRKNGSFQVDYMRKYKYWFLIGGDKARTFKTEEGAKAEVERRRMIIEKARVKLNNLQELDELIKYCFDNGYINQKNKLADLDRGYLYWKGILKREV